MLKESEIDKLTRRRYCTHCTVDYYSPVITVHKFKWNGEYEPMKYSEGGMRYSGTLSCSVCGTVHDDDYVDYEPRLQYPPVRPHRNNPDACCLRCGRKLKRYTYASIHPEKYLSDLGIYGNGFFCKEQCGLWYALKQVQDKKWRFKQTNTELAG